jgi:diacylglycerol kinase (ATP)
MVTKRALLVINRHSNQGENLAEKAISLLQNRNFEIIVCRPSPEESISQIILTHAAAVDFVILGGGDGSLNAGLDALVQTNRPVAILPLGTANDFARTVGIPTKLEDACDLIEKGNTKKVDVGRVNGKYYLNAASLGMSTDVTRLLDKKRKRFFGVFAYLFVAIIAIWKARRFSAEFIHDGGRFHARVVQIIVGNGRYYGGGMTISENASLNDGMLDVVCLETEKWWQILRLFPALRSGKYLSFHKVTTLRTKTLQVTTQVPKSVSTDGEFTTATPAFFEVLPEKLEVFVPEASPLVANLSSINGEK